MSVNKDRRSMNSFYDLEDPCISGMYNIDRVAIENNATVIRIVETCFVSVMSLQ